MATKHLARTVLEGGNTEKYRCARKRQNAWIRRQGRAFAQQCLRDPEVYWEQSVPAVKRRTDVWDRHTKKLRPVWRYLTSRVGRSWSEVYREIRQRFDDRTLVSHQVVHRHLLGEVAPEQDLHRTYDRCLVDADGILRERPRPWRRSRRYQQPSVTQAELDVWLDGRVAAAVGDAVFWFVPTGGTRQALRMVQEKRPSKSWCFPFEWVHTIRMRVLPAYRQGPRLTTAECGFWDRLTWGQQAEIGKDLRQFDPE